MAKSRGFNLECKMGVVMAALNQFGWALLLLKLIEIDAHWPLVVFSAVVVTASGLSLVVFVINYLLSR